MLIYFIERHTKYRPLVNCPISPRQNPKPDTRNLLHVYPCLYPRNPFEILNKCPNLVRLEKAQKRPVVKILKISIYHDREKEPI